MTDLRWLWYVTSACWWQRGVRRVVCDSLRDSYAARTSHCFESEMNTRKGWGIT
ncbi:hypothetical protein QUA20_04270 [Microcoleus sp. Pol7_A1]|uniref:hypothetical protein n=1 Tax=Microcoleus sp. Pol7_A1 TaxID=2818893 RepID=UPI002FD13045